MDLGRVLEDPHKYIEVTWGRNDVFGWYYRVWIVDEDFADSIITVMWRSEDASDVASIVSIDLFEAARRIDRHGACNLIDAIREELLENMAISQEPDRAIEYVSNLMSKLKQKYCYEQDRQ